MTIKNVRMFHVSRKARYINVQSSKAGIKRKVQVNQNPETFHVPIAYG